MIHNTQDLIHLRAKSIDEKITDAESFYILLGREVAPIMVRELCANIAHYREKIKTTPSAQLSQAN